MINRKYLFPDLKTGLFIIEISFRILLSMLDKVLLYIFFGILVQYICILFLCPESIL